MGSKLFVIQLLCLASGFAGEVHAQLFEGLLVYGGEDHGGVGFVAAELGELVQGAHGDRVGGGADGEGDEDFAEVEIEGFEIGNAVFDIENRSEGGGGDEVDGVGDAVDGFEGV